MWCRPHPLAVVARWSVLLGTLAACGEPSDEPAGDDSTTSSSSGASEGSTSSASATSTSGGDSTSGDSSGDSSGGEVCIPDPCVGCEGILGIYIFDTCAQSGGTIVTADLTCEMALDNCLANIGLIDDDNVYCEWNGVEIWRDEAVSGTCEPEFGPAPPCPRREPTCPG